ncbi:PXMP2/4 family protein 4 [Chlorella vulgaris]
MLATLRHPIVRAGLISSSTHIAGDLLCQSIRASRAGPDKEALNWRQTARFGLIGLAFHGPYFYNAFRWLDATLGPSVTFQRAALKSLTGQVTVFPVYLASFFVLMGTLEGLQPQQCAAKVQAALVPTWVAGSAFWPVVNTINFRVISTPLGRLVFANLAGLIWNTYLSYTNSTRGALVAAAGADGISGGKDS